MRTQGTLKNVYEAAKDFYNDADDPIAGGCPMDPVVRHTTDGVWMLESNMDSEPEADAECRLDDFNNWFYEAYSDDDYEPSEQDEMDFLESIRDANV